MMVTNKCFPSMYVFRSLSFRVRIGEVKVFWAAMSDLGKRLMDMLFGA